MTNKFAQRLKELREEKGISQRQLARESGISQARISCWELGTQVPTLYLIVKLVEFFKCTAGYLIGTED